MGDYQWQQIPQFKYGPGENPTPGFSARQSPMEAGARTATRNLIPGASLFMDRPEAGHGMDTWWKKGLGGIPFAGPGLFQPIFAGNRASEALQKNDFLYPEQESPFGRAMTTASAAARLTPAGHGADIFKNIVTGVQGARGVADFMNFNPMNIASGVGGLAGRVGYERFFGGGSQPGEGVPSSSPNSNWSPGLSERAGTTPWWQPQSWQSPFSGPRSDYSSVDPMRMSSPGQSTVGQSFPTPGRTPWQGNPFTNPDTGETPSWATSPYAQTPSGVPSILTQSPFYNPDTGTVPAWAQ